MSQFDGVAACADEQDEPLYAYPVMVQYNPVDTNASATLTLVHNAGGIEETQTNIELLATPPGCPDHASLNLSLPNPLCECDDNYYDINDLFKVSSMAANTLVFLLVTMTSSTICSSIASVMGSMAWFQKRFLLQKMVIIPIPEPVMHPV